MRSTKERVPGITAQTSSDDVGVQLSTWILPETISPG